MAMLTDEDREFLRSRFRDELQDEVTILAYTRKAQGLDQPGLQCEFCKETEELMNEVRELSDKIKMEVREYSPDDEMVKTMGIDKIPALVLSRGPDMSKGIRYFGIPGGFEFSSFVDDIMDISRNSTDLDPKTKNKVRGVNRDIHIQVFFTPTCPYCPAAVRTAHQMAMENPQHIRADAVEAAEFPDLISQYDITAVPTVVINNDIQFQGVLSEDEFADHIIAATR